MERAKGRVVPNYGLFVALAVVGLALRLVIAPLGGHPGDVDAFTRWAAALEMHGLLAIYHVSDANYPPLALALLGASTTLHRLVTGTAPCISQTWLVALKLPAILADLGIVWVIGWGRGMVRSGSSQGVLWLASLIVNPALIYLSAWWGQIESVYLLLALLALLLALRGRSFWAGACLGVALMVKLQAGMIAPLVALALLDGRPGRKTVAWQQAGSLLLAASGGVVTLISAMGPYLITGQGPFLMRRLVATVSGPGWITANALNAWYLITGGTANWAYNTPLLRPDTAPFIAGVSARTLGNLLLSVWTLGVIGAVWRGNLRAQIASSINREWRWLLAAALLYLGLFLWPTQARERYAFGAVVMLAATVTLAAQHSPSGCPVRLAALYALVTLAHTLNLMWAAPPAWGAWFAGQLSSGLPIAAGMVVLAVWGYVLLWRTINPLHRAPCQ